MPYLKIWVAEASYHGKEPLIYESDVPLPRGKIVIIPLKKQQVTGIVLTSSTEPAFPVKQIISVPLLKPLPSQLVDLHSWMREFYPAPSGAITQHFIPSSLSKKVLEVPNEKTKNNDPPPLQLPPLTADQEQAVASLQNPGLHLLHGETGTGKTRVYLELAALQFKKGRSSIILTPEIGLTSQLARELERGFGSEVVKVVHSQLTPNKRQKIWKDILQAESPLIVVGPRSALFAPLSQLGLIVVDEAHETAYKQDKAPYYHASTVSAQLAKLHTATLVLGSATPLIQDYFFAEAKNRPIIRMTGLAKRDTGTTTTFSVIDRRLKSNFARSSHLSDQLISGVEQALERNEQALLFLNRRGTARIILCEKCGWQALCPHCDLPLTYHGDTHSLICHSCSYKSPGIGNCPECLNPAIIFKSVGTKAIVDEVMKIFPGRKVQRFDADTVKADRLETLYESLRAGEVDILIGTQTISKGLDLPKLGFVGVINAETGLSFPDFTASERTYQLLTQVLGRVGRGHRNTQAVIQSYSPDNMLIQAAVTKKWHDFYNIEIAERKKFVFPPFCYLLKLSCRRSSRIAAEKAALELKKALTRQFPNVIIEGPAASFHEKIRNQYQWQLVVKSRSRVTLLAIVVRLPANWSYDIDPIDLL